MTPQKYHLNLCIGFVAAAEQVLKLQDILLTFVRCSLLVQGSLSKKKVTEETAA